MSPIKQDLISTRRSIDDVDAASRKWRQLRSELIVRAYQGDQVGKRKIPPMGITEIAQHTGLSRQAVYAVLNGALPVDKRPGRPAGDLAYQTAQEALLEDVD